MLKYLRRVQPISRCIRNWYFRLLHNGEIDTRSLIAEK